MRKDARLDATGVYRYTLTRDWDGGERVLWVMLNPSTADAVIDDPTIRRCINFSAAWGYGGLVVVNLFAYRVTDPSELVKPVDPVGPDNDRTIVDEASRASLIVAAWGAIGVFNGRHREVLKLLAPHQLHILGLTTGAQPRHPLYVRRDTDAQLWKVAA